MFPGGGADVVGLDHCAETACCCDGLQTGYACSDNKNAGRRDGSCGGHEHGKEARQAVGGGDYGLVTGDGGHRGERIHGLGAADAGDQFHAEERGGTSDCGGKGMRRVEGLEESDDDGGGLEAGLIACAWGVDKWQQVGGSQKGSAIRGDDRAGIDVVPIGCTGC